MRQPPEPTEEQIADQPRSARAYALGMLGAIAVAVAYGLSAEIFGLTWGLIAVGFIGGALLAAAVSRGAWQGRRHVGVRRLQVAAALLAAGAWLGGVLVAFVISQALLPQAATPLVERLSLGRFTEYAAGLDPQIRLAHAASLAAMAFMAWRGAR